MRHLKNRSLGKCLTLYWFFNLELFHPKQRNFDQNDFRFLNTAEKMIFLISGIDIVPFSISPMPGPNSYLFQSAEPGQALGLFHKQPYFYSDIINSGCQRYYCN